MLYVTQRNQGQGIKARASRLMSSAFSTIHPLSVCCEIVNMKLRANSLEYASNITRSTFDKLRNCEAERSTLNCLPLLPQPTGSATEAPLPVLSASGGRVSSSTKACSPRLRTALPESLRKRLALGVSHLHEQVRTLRVLVATSDGVGV